jgi:hypothetical protein
MKSIVPLVNILFYGLALLWITRLESSGCECSRDWRRDYMKYFFLAVILFQAVLLTGVSKDLIKLMGGPIGVASLVYLWVTITYVRGLRQSACGCAGGYQQTVLYWMAVVQAVLLAWSVFVHVKA